MKIAVSAGYWSAGPPPQAADLFRIADAFAEQGLIDSVWTSEAYGSDALTPLAWWGAATQRVRLGTNIAQLSARTPAATAMAALTLDHLSGGRFVLGLGVSGPQVVEGWYGQPFAKPLARTREYIRIVREIIARDAPVTNDGPAYPLPVPGSTHGKALRSTVHPLRTDLPIYLAAEGPANISLAAEIADGWLAAFYDPDFDVYFRERLDLGFATPGARRQRNTFEVVASVYAASAPTLDAAADAMRPLIALYVGGMGAQGANFHADAVARLGFEAECAAIQERYLAGDRKGAAAAVPTAMVDRLTLIGPPERIAERMERYRGSVVDTLIVQGDRGAVEAAARGAAALR
ncbi:LLM class F420-dependent oxidoreductase [Micrococcales bacterium 31B]|nr:LLM class F420-dependent oxidoreductase [Micrococcales bacterium 31B]